MTAQNQNDPANLNPNIVAAYNQLCTSYHNIDGFRQALLGALPLASATGIYFLAAKVGKEITADMLTSSGIFGFVITLGLLVFDIHGIRQCTHLIVLGLFLEKQLGIEGQFTNRSSGLQPIDKANYLRFVNEPLATAIIYPSVLGGWVFLAFSHKSLVLSPYAPFFGMTVFFIGFFLLLYFDYWLVDIDSKAKCKELKARNPLVDITCE